MHRCNTVRGYLPEADDSLRDDFPADLKEKLQDQDQPVPREILANPASREKPGPGGPPKSGRPAIQYLRD